MTDRVIEPSEIIVEQPNKPKENIAHANPWIRFLARFFDYSLFFLLLLASRKMFHGQIPFGKVEHLIPFEYFIWIPIEALFLTFLGTTPGKFFLKTKLKQGKREKFQYMGALKRGFAVWFRGLGMFIPILNFFCLLNAYHKLKLLQITSWDRDDHVTVTHYPIGRWRIYIAVFVAATGILYYYSEKRAELTHVAKNHFRSVDEFSLSGTNPTRSNFQTQSGCSYWCNGS